MTEPKQVQIIKALRTRIESAGFTVKLGEEVDPKEDDLPAVMLGHTREGTTTIQDRFPAKRAMHLVGECWFEPDEEDSFIEGLKKLDDLKTALIQVPTRDRPDTLGDLADSVETGKEVVHTKDNQSRLGVAQVSFTVTYYEG